MGSEEGELQGVVAGEIARLHRWAEALKRDVDELRERYPSAQQLVDDVAAVRKANAEFEELIQGVQWDREVARIGRKITEQTGDVEEGTPLRLVWRSDRGGFAVVSEEPQGEERFVDAMAWMNSYHDVVRSVSDERTGVAYPILFTHQVEHNHRAIAAALAWAVMDKAGQRVDGQDVKVELPDSSKAGFDERPDARDFGFEESGELRRRIRDFDQADPAAHWRRWFAEGFSDTRQQWKLRRPDGAALEVEVDPQLRRMRLRERPASQVVRKRRNVFVDPVEATIFDRYFADRARLEEAAAGELRRRLDDGYRVVRFGDES